MTAVVIAEPSIVGLGGAVRSENVSTLMRAAGENDVDR
jgi:hypothetical protein